VYASQDENEFFTQAGETKTWKLWVDNVLSPTPFRMGKDSNGADQHRWEGVGTNHFNVWDKDAIDHGFVLSFWNDDDGWWEEDSRTKGVGNMSIDQYFSGDGFLTVRVENHWAYDIRLATSAKAINDQDQYVDGPGDRPAYHIGGTYIQENDTSSVIFRSKPSMLKYGARNL